MLRQRIRDLAASRPRFGYERLHILLRREGWRVNRKRVHRLYKLEGLQLRMLALGSPQSAAASNNKKTFSCAPTWVRSTARLTSSSTPLILTRCLLLLFAVKVVNMGFHKRFLKLDSKHVTSFHGRPMLPLVSYVSVWLCLVKRIDRVVIPPQNS